MKNSLEISNHLLFRQYTKMFIKITDRSLQSFPQLHPGFPACQFSTRQTDFRTSLLRIILWKWLKNKLRLCSCQINHLLCQFQLRELNRITDIYRTHKIIARLNHPNHSFQQVSYILKRPCLPPITKNGGVLS